MENNEFDKFIKNTASPVPPRPVNEYAMILKRIEEDKTILETLWETLSSKVFWGTAITSTAVACFIMISLNQNSAVEETLSYTASLYSDELSPSDEVSLLN